jgi:two-component system OmpR family sensor kinase
VVAQVVTNLLANCARHAPGSRIEVRARHDDGFLVVEVYDDGPGAPAGSEETLVEEGVTGAVTGGSGLGLSVSRRLLAAQGGGMRVLPMTGRGFRVRCTLPAASVWERRSQDAGDRVGERAGESVSQRLRTELNVPGPIERSEGVR